MPELHNMSAHARDDVTLARSFIAEAATRMPDIDARYALSLPRKQLVTTGLANTAPRVELHHLVNTPS